MFKRVEVFKYKKYIIWIYEFERGHGRTKMIDTVCCRNYERSEKFDDIRVHLVKYRKCVQDVHFVPKGSAILAWQRTSEQMVL